MAGRRDTPHRAPPDHSAALHRRSGWRHLGTRQRWIWLAAVCYDFAAVFITSKITQGWRIQSAAHFAERYGLIVLPAIGESIVAVAAGLGLAHEHLVWRVVIGAAFSILIALGLYMAYFGRLLEDLGGALEKTEGRERARLGEDVFTYFHFPIIAGIILAALGVDLPMEAPGHPRVGTVAGWSLGAGVALFRLGTVAAGRGAGQPWPTARVVALVVLAALSPLLASVARCRRSVHRGHRPWAGTLGGGDGSAAYELTAV